MATATPIPVPTSGTANLTALKAIMNKVYTPTNTIPLSHEQQILAAAVIELALKLGLTI